MHLLRRCAQREYTERCEAEVVEACEPTKMHRFQIYRKEVREDSRKESAETPIGGIPIWKAFICENEK